MAMLYSVLNTITIQQTKVKGSSSTRWAVIEDVTLRVLVCQRLCSSEDGLCY
jgi:hypothetical protein